MTAILIDGKALSATLRAQYKAATARLVPHGITPALSIILVGDNSESQSYVRGKVKACTDAGMKADVHQFSADLTQEALLAAIGALNANTQVHGILVQLPLPAHIDVERVIGAVHPSKDVDGLGRENVGALVEGHPPFPPCTPAGVMAMLDSIGVDPAGKEAVVVGRSNLVGKPMALLLLNAGATVTVCHRGTRDLAGHTRRADILVVAAGHAALVGADGVKPGAVVIDVGLNYQPDGRILGDVDFAAVAPLVSAISPVPGGVGPMTITMLVANTLRSAERAAGL